MAWFSKKKKKDAELALDANIGEYSPDSGLDKSGFTEKENQRGLNPYLNGRREWMERYGSYIIRAKQWRTFCLLLLFACCCSMAINVIQVMQVKIIPYIVQVDKLGKTQAVGRADKLAEPSENLIKATIASFIEDWRTVTADIQLQQKMIERLTFFSTGSAKGVLREWYIDNNPYEVVKGGRLVQVVINVLPQPISKGVYQVEWTEKFISHQGVTLGTKDYRATVGVQVATPSSEEMILINPVGIFVTQLTVNSILKN